MNGRKSPRPDNSLFYRRQGAAEQPGHEGRQQKGNSLVEVAEGRLEGDNDDHFKDDGGETHRGQWDEEPGGGGGFKLIENGQADDNKNQRQVKKPEQGNPREKTEEARLESFELTAPEERMKEITDGLAVAIDTAGGVFKLSPEVADSSLVEAGDKLGGGDIVVSKVKVTDSLGNGIEINRQGD